jgi:hypothetical protein
MNLFIRRKNMEMSVKTKEDLPESIVLEGEVAEKIQKAQKTKKIGTAVGIGGGIVAVAGVISAITARAAAAPVTGELSSGATAPGVAGFTVTIGGISMTLTTAEFAIIAGVIVSILGVLFAIAKDLLNHYDVEFSNNTVKLTRKQ